VKSFDARVLTCRNRQNVKMWFALERALIVTFREEFGEIPHCNIKGKSMQANRVFEIFARERVRRLIRNLSE